MNISIESFALTFDAGKSASFNLSAEQTATLLSHPAVVANLITIGLINKLKDSYAGITQEGFKTEDEWRLAQREKAELTLGALMRGEVRVSTAPKTPKLSGEETFRRSFILAELKKLFIDKHGKDSWKEKTEGDSGAVFIAALLEKHGARYAESATEAWNAELAKRANTAKLAAEIDFDI